MSTYVLHHNATNMGCHTSAPWKKNNLVQTTAVNNVVVCSSSAALAHWNYIHRKANTVDNSGYL